MTPELFITNVMPEILKEVPKPVHGLFITYNTMLGFDKSTFEGDFNDDTTVICGFDVVSFMQSFGSARKSICEHAQKSIHNTVLTLLNVTEDKNMFSVVYAGERAFSQALECAVLLKQARTRSIVYVLTCDCNLEQKVQSLQALIDTGGIDGTIVTKQCGGIRDMTEMHNAFIDILHSL